MGKTKQRVEEMRRAEETEREDMGRDGHGRKEELLSAAGTCLCTHSSSQAVTIYSRKARRGHISSRRLAEFPSAQASTWCLARLLLAAVEHSTPRDGGVMEHRISISMLEAVAAGWL
jgi:hypothetical protein